MRGLKKTAAIGLLLLASLGCASHQTKLDGPRELLKAGQFTEAQEKLKSFVQEGGGDELLSLMEYGTAQRIAGNYQDSIKTFLRADKLSEQNDYYSVSRTALAALGTEEMLQYKGESYERLLLNAYLAMNFLAVGQPDEAMVEVRRMNEKTKKIRQEGRADYENSPFAIYLSALIYEADRRFDDAYIAYENVYKIDPSNPSIGEDLIRSAKLARRNDTYEKWKREFPSVVEDQSWYDSKLGQVLVIYEQGWGPRKDYAIGDARFPRLVPSYSQTQSITAETRGGKPVRSTPIYDLQSAAIQTLDADYKWIIARKLAAIAAKEVVSDQIRQKDEALGLIVNLVMHATDRADLRNWVTLPQRVQVVRIRLPAGSYKIDIKGYDAYNSPTADQKEDIAVTVKQGRTSFISYRSLR